MPKLKLTHRGIAKFTATGRWLTDYWDEDLPGFGVRAHHTGRRTFFVRYTTDNGKRRRINIGTHPTLSLADARGKAREIIGRLARGEDPQAEKAADRDAIKFGRLAADYVELYAKPRKRSWREDERVIRVELLPTWKNRKAKTISRRDISELLDGIVQRGAPIMANRTRALISKVFNFGIGRDLVEHNPCHRLPMPAKAQQRDRVLDEDEIRRFWQALAGIDPLVMRSCA